MTQGKLWIHFDAQFPLGFGRDLQERFGPAGELLFIQFLCACKRSFPQGQIRYRTDSEALVLLGATYALVDGTGQQWALDDFWKWCGYRRVTSSARRNGYRIVTASRWDRWEIAPDEQRKANNRDRMRRSRAKASRAQLRMSRPEVEVEVEVEVEKSPPTPSSAPASDVSTSAGRRGNGHRKPEDPLIDRIRSCVPGTGVAAARQTVERLRQAGIGDIVIDEAAGYAAEHGANSARYIEQVATDWMTQRDPTWNSQAHG